MMHDPRGVRQSTATVRRGFSWRTRTGPRSCPGGEMCAGQRLVVTADYTVSDCSGGQVRWIAPARQGYTRANDPMAQVNAETRELAVKVVYYGPALSGKTTNLQALFDRIDPRMRGRLMRLDTKDDRTLFFDMLPVFFRTPAGFKVKLKLYTVPGQVMHESTRRIVLQGTDAVAFVADCRRSEAGPTLAYWNDMLANLAANGLDPRTLPVVLQMNKRDLPDARGDEELGDLRRVIAPPVIPAVAIRGDGVVETLHALLTLCYRQLDARLGLSARFGVPEQDFIGHIFSHVDLRGARLPPARAAP
jgi:mutual gliding-motility protein MglA